MSETRGFYFGDYYNTGHYSPNHIYENTDNAASRIIDAANSLLADETSGSQFSFGGEAFSDSEVIMGERHFHVRDTEAETLYGGRPVEQSAVIRYGRSLEWGGMLEEYDITTQVSIGGVQHEMLKNRYFIEVIGNNNEVSDAYVLYKDVASNWDRKRFMTPFDGEQLLRFLTEMKQAYLQGKKAEEQRYE